MGLQPPVLNLTRLQCSVIHAEFVARLSNQHLPCPVTWPSIKISRYSLFYSVLRGGPFLRTGFTILSAKAFLGHHPPTLQSFRKPVHKPVHQERQALLPREGIGVCSDDLYILKHINLQQYRASILH